MGDRISKHVLERVAADSMAHEFWDALGQLPCPLLVARPGTGRGIIDDDVETRYRTARPDAEMVSVPEAPHDLFRPDRLYYPAAVAEFLYRWCPGL